MNNDTLSAIFERITVLETRLAEYDSSFALYNKASMSLMYAYKRAHPEIPENVWPDATKVNVWAAELIERLQPEIKKDIHGVPMNED